MSHDAIKSLNIIFFFANLDEIILLLALTFHYSYILIISLIIISIISLIEFHELISKIFLIDSIVYFFAALILSSLFSSKTIST